MIKAWIKCTIFFIIGCFLLVVCAVCWLAFEAGSAHQVMRRFGGIEVVGDWSVTPSGADDLYVRAVSLRPQQDIVYDMRALQPCTEYTRECMVQEAAAINLQMISTGMILKDVDEFFEKYKPSVESFDDGCPAVYETTAIIKENEVLSRLPVERRRIAAQEVMEKIKNDGGLTYSLVTPECRSFFREKPYMARAYTLYLALIMHRAEGSFSASWVFLAVLPEMRSGAR
ncbi:hypothetical protein [Pseudomonas sp. MPC6]|uniref:hypothetical protein n=1 Tax=unclassified Pseudomonas TaxID=196821 RepID=UPI0011100865|nr:hypothetical protein [Pseudomonas sp. MPC6]QCY14594.1 hypothetical protein ELQ88_29570 [Pseudomonas sp. MPC6]